MKTIILSILLFSTAAFTATLEKVTFEDKMKVQGKDLVLNGLGVRLATWVNIRVYVAGLYLEKKSKNENEILNSKGLKYLSMRFKRDVDAESIRDAWTESYDKKFSAKVKKLNAMMPDLKEKDDLAVTFLGEKILVSVNGKEKGQIAGKDFEKATLAIFIGPKPPNKELKEGLLKGE